MILFCRHNWKSHAKQKYVWNEYEIRKETRDWFNPIWDVVKYSEVREVLICKKCGKIKEITY